MEGSKSAAAAPNPYKAAASLPGVTRLEIIFRPDDSDKSEELIGYLFDIHDSPEIDVIIPNKDEYTALSAEIYEQIRRKKKRLPTPCRSVGDELYKRSSLAVANLIVRSLDGGRLRALTVAHIDHLKRTIRIDSICSTVGRGGTSHMNIVKDILHELSYKRIELTALPEVVDWYHKFGFKTRRPNANDPALSFMTLKRKNSSRFGPLIAHTTVVPNNSGVGNRLTGKRRHNNSLVRNTTLKKPRK